MRVKWLRVALSKLNAEADYIARDNPTAAKRVVDLIVNATERLKRYPGMGVPGE